MKHIIKSVHSWTYLWCQYYRGRVYMNFSLFRTKCTNLISRNVKKNNNRQNLMYFVVGSLREQTLFSARVSPAYVVGYLT